MDYIKMALAFWLVFWIMPYVVQFSLIVMTPTPRYGATRIAAPAKPKRVSLLRRWLRWMNEV